MLLAVFGSMFFLLIVGVPIAVCIGVSSMVFSLWIPGGLDRAMILVAQKMIVTADSFTLLALPFFFLIVLAYFGYQWARGFFAGHAGDRDFRRHLHGLTVNPQDADAHYQLGLIHFKRRNLDAARRYFESALKIDPEDADYHYYLGRTHEQEGDWAPALEHYSEVYRIDPEYGLGDIFREVGKGYLHTGNVEKAMEFLNYFLSRRGSDPEGRYWLAVALQKSGDPAQMRAQLRRILEQARTNPRFFRKEHREWIYRARNMMRDSRFAFRD